ncbi:MAG: ATP-binding protein [bacterium]
MPNNLPLQLTSFIGRDREKAEVRQLLAATRLLTFTGVGGVGKTRLALQVAAEVLEDFKYGVWLVDLAPIADPHLTPRAVAAALHVREQAGRLLFTTLSDYLRNKNLLLLLDNCEHVLSMCAELVDALLRGCPDLRVMATSREPLGISGEVTWSVPSLSLPEPHRLPPAENLAEYEAVRLFVERALAASPSFRVTDQNALAVAQVCHQLDGIPLAIELAAARMKAMSVEQIAARMDNRFRLLKGGRTAVARHQTLRRVMDWSYDLLLEKERAVLRRLSVFAGGLTLEAGEAVCGGDGIDEVEVLDLLALLVDKSLLVADEQGGDMRYRLLERLRQYSRERLIKSREAQEVHGRHLRFFLRLAEKAEPHLTTAGQLSWLSRLEMEHDNLRVALEWALNGGELEAGLRLAGALWKFWYGHGHFSEGREWLEKLLARGSDASASTRGQALVGAGVLAWRQGDYRLAETRGEESLRLYRDLGEKHGIAYSLNLLGVTARDQGRYERATELHSESLAQFRELGDDFGIAFAVADLGRAAFRQGDYDTAAALSEESLALFRKVGERWGTARSLFTLARIALRKGDYERAATLCEESLAMSRELGDKEAVAHALQSLGIVAGDRGHWDRAMRLLGESVALFRELGDKKGLADSLSNLGAVTQGRGHYVEAARFHKECLPLRRELGDTRGIAGCLESLATVARFRARLEHAARLFGVAEALREAVGSPLPSSRRSAYDSDVAAVRAELGDHAYARAWASGRAMTLDQAFISALEGDL